MRESWQWVRWIMIAAFVVIGLWALAHSLIGDWEAPLFMDWIQTATTSEIMMWSVFTLWLGSSSYSSSCNCKK